MKAPSVPVKLRAMSDAVTRGLLASFFGRSHSGNRDLYAAFGYPRVIQPNELMAMYLRNGIASRVIRAFPGATWSDTPLIRDERGETSQLDSESFSPFVASVENLFEKHRVFHHIERADRLASIGRYGILVMGFQDGLRPDQPLVSKNAPLLYLQAYGESNITINEFDKDTKSPRYGRPLKYTVRSGSLSGEKTSQMKSTLVHWSRVIHIAEFLDEDEVYGTPRLLPIYNHLMDLEKVVGAGAETFWLNARPGLGLFADKEATFTPESLADMKKQADNYDHQLQRILALQGVTAQQFSAAIADPKPNIDTLLDLIAGTVAMPKRILIGSERGELSSTQDETNWSSQAGERRENFATPTILKPFVSRMIETGNIIAPDGRFWVEWPDAEALGPKAKADLGQIKTAMLAQYVASPGADLIVPPSEFRKDFLGIEAKTEYTDEVDEAAEEQMPEDNPEVVEQFNLRKNYSPDQERADDGKFGSGGGGSSTKGKGDDDYRSPPSTTVVGEVESVKAGKQPDGGFVSDANGGPSYNPPPKDGGTPAVSSWRGGEAQQAIAPGDKSLHGGSVERKHYELATKSAGGPLSNEERDSIFTYTTESKAPGGYVKMNASLRAGKMTPKVKESVDKLDKVFAKTAIAENVLAYRSVPPAVAEGMLKNVGGTFTDAGFVSTTADPNFNFGAEMVKVKVKIPKGSKALPIADHSRYGEEAEVLINRGSKFKVTKSGKDIILELQS